MSSLLTAGLEVFTLPYLPRSWQLRMAEKRVIATVQDAYQNVPFYRQKYSAAGIDMRSIREIGDIKRLPTITKDEIRSAFPDEIVRKGTDIESCHSGSTMGSTGKPLPFIISPEAYRYYLAESARIYDLAGYRPWQRACYVRFMPMELPGFSSRRQTYISSLLPVGEIIGKLALAKPDLIDAYPTNMLEIARNIGHEELKRIKPSRIVVNSEMSTQEEREYIAEVFGCPVFDEYSTEECWGIAAQCRRHNYHLFIDSVWVEFVDEGGNDCHPGQSGSILLTTTRSAAMPFIRYAVGDRGTPVDGECGCGNNLPLMQSIEGRSDDWVVLPSGQLFEPVRILSIIAKIMKIHPRLFDEYKVIQKKTDLLVIQYRPGEGFDQAAVDEMVAVITDLLYEPMTVLAEKGEPYRGLKRQTLESWVARPL